MRISIWAKLFLGSVVLTAVASGSAGAYLEAKLSTLLLNRIEDEVRHHAQTLQVAYDVEASAGAPGAKFFDEATADEFADRFGAAAGARVTVLTVDGRVIGDSAVPRQDLARVPSHADRPEVQQALKEGVGLAQRTSDTLGVDMLYSAARLNNGRGVLRIAMPLTAIGEQVLELRIALTWAACIALLVSLLASALASRVATRTLRGIVERTRAIAKGGKARMEVFSADELGALAGSINQMADDLQTAVGDLASERDRLHAVLQCMKEGVLVVDDLNNIELLNPAAKKLLGVQGASEHLAKAVGAPALPQLATAGGSELGGAEFPWRGRRLRAHASDLKASKSRVFVIHDVTKERQLDDMRRDFIANVSHELRTPVSVIRANSETLLDGALPATEVLATKFVQATLRNAERLSSLIADLLDLASIEGGGYKLEPRELLVEPACQRVAEALAESASARNIRIEVNVADEVQVYADSRALDQVITNLLANAIKYTHEGTLIYIGAELVARGVRIHVDDQGPGIPDEHRPRVFERFYRVDVSRSRALGGTGLGLAIAKHLTSAMGGKIGVEPVEPNGCSFWFILPPRQPVGERFSYAPEA